MTPSEIMLTKRERQVLEVFLLRPGQWIYADDLIDAVWAGGCARHTPCITIGRLRQKLQDTPYRIESRQWHGYRLVERKNGRAHA